MLIDDLGQARERLLESFAGLSDSDLNRAPADGRWCVGAVLLHVAQWEQALADRVLEAAQARRTETVAELDVDALRARVPDIADEVPPPIGQVPRTELVRALEASRFAHLQRVFNKAHVQTLAGRCLVDPEFGRLNLKNAVDLIWLHDDLHIRQIEGIRAALA